MRRPRPRRRRRRWPAARSGAAAPVDPQEHEAATQTDRGDGGEGRQDEQPARGMRRGPIVGDGGRQRAEDEPREAAGGPPAAADGSDGRARPRRTARSRRRPAMPGLMRGFGRRAAEQVGRRPLRPVVRPGERQGVAVTPSRNTDSDRVRARNTGSVSGEAVRDEDRPPPRARRSPRLTRSGRPSVRRRMSHDGHWHDDVHQQCRMIGIGAECEDDRRGDRRPSAVVAQADPEQPDPGDRERAGRRPAPSPPARSGWPTG